MQEQLFIIKPNMFMKQTPNPPVIRRLIPGLKSNLSIK